VADIITQRLSALNAPAVPPFGSRLYLHLAQEGAEVLERLINPR